MALRALGCYTDHARTRVDVLLASLRDETLEIRKAAAQAICSLAQEIGLGGRSATNRQRPEGYDLEDATVLSVLQETLKQLVRNDELNNPPFTERALNWIARVTGSSG
jgi:hypothetical protein